MGTGIVICVYYIGKELFDKKVGYLSAATAALCPTLLLYSHTSNVDVPYIFWAMLGILFYIRMIKERRRRNWIAFGIFSALSVSTKDQAYGLFGLLPLAILGIYRRDLRTSLRRETRFKDGLFRNLIASMAAFLVTYGTINILLPGLSTFGAHLRHILGPGVGAYREYEHGVTGYLGMVHLIVLYVRQAFGWPFFLVCLMGLVYALRRFPKKTLILILPGISYCLLFLGATMYVYPRFILPIVLLGCVLVGKVLVDLLLIPARPTVKILTVLGLSLILIYSTARAYATDLVLISDSRILAGRWIESYVPEGARISVYVNPATLPYLSQDYKVQRASGALEQLNPCDEEKADFIIFTSRLYHQTERISEEEAFRRKTQNKQFSSVLAGELGYDLVADIKYRPHPWLDLHVPVTFNPRIFILKRTASCDKQTRTFSLDGLRDLGFLDTTDMKVQGRHYHYWLS